MKRLIIAFILLLLVCTLFAGTVNKETASVIGRDFYRQLSGLHSASYEIEPFFGGGSLQPDLYILRFKPKGFVLIAAEEQSSPVLGYSLEADFPAEQLAPHVAWYLQQYSLGMEEIRSHPEWAVDPLWEALQRGDYSAYEVERDVAPILTTTWDQGWPYNSMCPADTDGPGGRVWAGCVATAMGQVMKKWNHPTTGNGSHSYYAAGYGTQSANFGATTYNWASMPNSITSVNTAISTLLYHCGVAVEMMYAPDGSGAYSEDARDAMVDYFRYNSAAQLLTASSYNATTWATMLRGDLDLGRPIYYAGSGAGGGHAFVVDGYQGTNYFHFNWGWSGSYNGYFYLTNLNPGSHSFTQNQRAMLYVYPVASATNDLAAVSLTGPGNIIVNQSGTFIATITNAGSATQTSYSVRLMRDTGTQLASVAGTSIAAGATLTFPLSWTPTAVGNYNLYAQVYLSTDTNSANNNSPTIPVAVSQSQNEPPTGVTAALSGNNVVVNWTAPGGGAGEWIHYDSGENDDSIGTGGVADFDVAVRFPGSALTSYVGMSLYAVKLWPAQAGTFTARVWTGGSATVPGSMVINQTFTPVLNTYNTVVLGTPVAITGTQELWFGMRCNVTSGYPAGCDAGPAVNGFGNMMYWQGAWTTLLALAPTLNYNWNIQGYVGYSAPTRAPEITLLKSRPLVALTDDANRYSEVSLAASGRQGFGTSSGSENERVVGYKVWRLLSANQGNEASWTSLTPNPITPVTYTDTGWGAVPSGTYKWAVKAVYTGGVLSVSAFSNDIVKAGATGTIAGIVRNQQNQAITGATVTAGSVTATTNASGAYSLSIAPGTYTVSASHPSYSPSTQTGVVVVSGQTTTVNFILSTSTTNFQDGFETYNDFALTFAPWTCVDVDLSTTYSMTGITWPSSGAAFAYMVFNPSATTPPITTFAPHGGTKMAVAIASTTPPNNDWLISPLVAGGGSVSFWARSLTDQYGLERFKVGVSTTGTQPANFTIISGASYIQAPIDWTQYTYSLAAYAGQQIYIGIQCVSNDAWIFMVDDFAVSGGTQPQDPFGNPVVLPTSMTVVAGVTIGGQQAANGDVLAAYVTVGGTPQLRGKQTVQVIEGIAGCVLQVYTETNGETISFKVWDMSANEVINSPTTLASIVNGTVGSWPGNLFMIDASASTTQSINLATGWNLISLNVSPANHTIASLIAPISTLVQQIKGTEGVYIPGNPYSTLTSLTDGRAYNFLMSAASAWSVTGAPIPVSTPLALVDGWNMVAYLPQGSLPVATAVSSIATWLVQVKGTDGVYIPGNPYSTLTTMYPGKGYWIKINGAHSLIYPGTRGEGEMASWRVGELERSVDPERANATPVLKLFSMTVLAKCNAASAGDILLAKVNGELRGRESFISPEGFPAALIQVYTDADGEELSFSIMKPNGSEIPLATKLLTQINGILGSYPDFISLEPMPLDNDDLVAIPTELIGAHPNPFSPSTTISFSVAKDNTPVTIEIYNIKGQKVRTLLGENLHKGSHSQVWNGTDDNNRSVSSGTYIITMKAAGYSKTTKALLIK